ncbi:hypothetical protein CASFOL_023654 [Castilleja foliolosa]|uniref:Protein kinase domain-containing protein n=1 Tax=Castilleja foliolosa TaxID=1961234 RepID=A0ABD3CPM5_9LAMI
MSAIYDNWERLVAAVVKREEIWQLCHQHSRSSSFCSESSDLSNNPSLWLSDVDVQKKPVPRLIFIGGPVLGFPSGNTLKLGQELGQGTFGTTFVAELLQDVEISGHEVLACGTKVVTKLLNEVHVTEEEFKEQMKVLGCFKHENVAAPRAYYYSGYKVDRKVMVVYDLHSQGSVFDMLHGNRTRPNWESRLKIAIGAARGIAHIHTQSGLAHGNIKSSNIFVNSQQYGCVSDFGLSGVVVKPSYTWYLRHHDRKYVFKPVPQETDVYSFGYILLEILTGKSSKEAQGIDKDIDLSTWACSIKPEQWTSKLFDQSLKKQIMHERDVFEMMRTEIPDVYNSVVRDSYSDWEEVRAIVGSSFRSMGRRVPAEYFADPVLFEMRETLKVAMRCLYGGTSDKPKMCDVVLMLENVLNENVMRKPKQDQNNDAEQNNDSPHDEDRVWSRILRFRRS